MQGCFLCEVIETLIPVGFEGRKCYSVVYEVDHLQRVNRVGLRRYERLQQTTEMGISIKIALANVMFVMGFIN